MSASSYADLGNGWFFDFGQRPFGYVVDSRVDKPNVLYRGNAWRDGIGPVGGVILLTVNNGPWLSERGIADYPFPGKVKVNEGGIAAGLGQLEGRAVETLDELVALLGADGITRELKVYTSEEREHFFGGKRFGANLREAYPAWGVSERKEVTPTAPATE